MYSTTRFVCSILLSCAAVLAQGTTAQINGNIQDSSGLGIPGASIKATQTATGSVRTATSGTDGSYVLTNLPIGPYTLEVTKDGFNKYVQTGVVLQVDSNPTIDASLKVGSVNEQVTVQADAALVETHSTGVGTVVDNQRVIEMPLNGRNATELVFLAGMATVGGANGGFLNEFVVPFWVISVCASAITLGILSGGWRIVRTVGFGIYKVRPLHALNAQLTSAAVILTASQFGAPVSTTHVVSSSIMGIGASERPKAVRWSKAQDILRTWLITIPAAGVVGAVAALGVRLIFAIT